MNLACVKAKLGVRSLKWADYVFADVFLSGDACSDPVRAHEVVIAIVAGGPGRYPALWVLADQYVREYGLASRLGVVSVGFVIN